MNQIYLILIPIHIAVGFASLIIFWIPIISRKGSALHLRSGRWYANAMYIVSASALALAILLITNPIAAKFPNTRLQGDDLADLVAQQTMMGVFLLSISILVLANVRHGLMALKSKRNHALMRSPGLLGINAALVTMGFTLAVLGSMESSATKVLFFAFAGLCTILGSKNLYYCLRKSPPRMEWLVEHLSNMVAAGIGSYTAFAVFGGQRFLAELLQGYWGIVPWVAPGVVGGVIIAYQTRSHRKKFNR